MKKVIFTLKNSFPLSNRYRICAVALLILIGGHSCFSQNATGVNVAPGVKQNWSVSPFDQKAFIENKGQIDHKNITTSSSSSGIIKYAVNDNGTEIYFTTSGLTYKHNEYKELNEEEIISASKTAAADDGDKDGHVMTKTISHFVFMNWIGANTDAAIVASDIVSDYYTYPDMQDKSGKSCIKANAYKKITYKNIYPFIDVEYTFPINKPGIKYSLILHPGADASVIKMHYSQTSDPVDENSENAEGVTLDAEGNIQIETSFGNIVDHAPVSLYENGGKINSGFTLSGETVSFKLDKQTASVGQTIIIDPWTTNPGFTSYNAAYDVDFDLSGNVYVYGGSFPWQEIKFNKNGVKQWTYTASLLYATGCGSGGCYGDFAVDGNSGSSYIVEAFNGGPVGCRVIKLNQAGTQIGLYPGTPDFGEMWRIKFNNCTGQAIIAGGGTTYTYQAAVLDTDVANMAPVNILSASSTYHDIALLAIDNDSNCYMATTRKQTEVGVLDNVLLKGSAISLLPVSYMVPDNHLFIEVESVAYIENTKSYANGYNGIAVNNKYVYTYDGSVLKKWDKNTGAFLNMITLDTIPFQWGGLEVNACDVFAGVRTSVVHLDSNLTIIDTIPVYNNIYDLRIGPGNILYAAGLGFVSSLSLPVSACTNLTVSATPDSCGSKGTATVTLNGGIGPFTYIWSNGQTTKTATGLSSGTYQVTVNDNGVLACIAGSGSQTTTVTVPGGGGGATASAGPDTSICAGFPVQLNCTTSGTSYAWSPSTGLSDTTIANPVAYVFTTTTYTVTVTSTGGCSGTATVTITIFPAPQAPSLAQSNTYPDTLYCVDDSSAIIAHQWYFNGTLIPGQTGASYIATQSGNYNVAVTDTNGCQISVGINIIINGIQNLSQDNLISIFPNPADDQVTVVATSIHSNELILISITDVLGQIVQVERMKWNNNISINVKALSSGIYFLQIQSENLSVVKKFVKD